ncbi:MAG: hypothetical protein KDE27_07045 [Planctomycetes bacterium]|nr:hypothetical protein [Planctomycetota bacterium]
MRVVLVDSPGSGPGPHWSSAFVAELAGELTARGVDVLQLGSRVSPGSPLHRVSAAFTDVREEVALTKALRHESVHAVVHAGVGARGSPNMLWIGARLGPTCVGVVRAAEVVCQRGDLVDRDGSVCTAIDDPERCTWCCSGPVFRRARPDGFRNRLDLVVAGLQAAATVWLPDGDDPALLERVGVPRRALRSAPAEDLVQVVAAELSAPRVNDPVS